LTFGFVPFKIIEIKNYFAIDSKEIKIIDISPEHRVPGSSPATATSRPAVRLQRTGKSEAKNRTTNKSKVGK
jgi:hypothetical protein